MADMKKDALTPEEIRPGSRAESFVLTKIAIWKSRIFRRFLPYLVPIRHIITPEEPSFFLPPHKRKAVNGVLSVSWAMRLGHWLSVPFLGFRRKTPARRKADVLLVGEHSQYIDLSMSIALIRGIAASGRTLMYLINPSAAEFPRLQEAVTAEGLEAAVQFIKPEFYGVNLVQKATRLTHANYRSRRDAARLMRFLPPGTTLCCNGDMIRVMRDAALAQISWKYLAHSLEYSSVIVTQRSPLSTVVAMSAIDQQKPAVLLQDALVNSRFEFAPLVANRMVCFSEATCGLLRDAEDAFARKSGRASLCREFVPGGCLQSDFHPASNPFAAKTLLALEYSEAETHTFGNHGCVKLFHDVIHELCENPGPIQRIVIRLKPGTARQDDWLTLKEQYPNLVELSHHMISEKADLAHASLLLGIADLLLPVAAAGGIPFLCLQESTNSRPLDFSVFPSEAFVLRDTAVARIHALLTDESRYQDASQDMRAAAEAYFGRGERCEFTPEFIARMLAPIPRLASSKVS